MVNSGWWSAVRSRLRKTRARLKIRSSPAARSFLSAEFRRGVQEEARASAVGRHKIGREGMQMRLVARRDLECRGLDLDEALRLEMRPERLGDAVAGHQERPAVGVHVRRPEGRGFGLGVRQWPLSQGLVIRANIAMVRAELAVLEPPSMP